MEGLNGGRLKRGGNWGNRGGGRPITHGRYALFRDFETVEDLLREQALAQGIKLAVLVECMGKVLRRHVTDPDLCAEIEDDWSAIAIEHQWQLGVGSTLIAHDVRGEASVTGPLVPSGLSRKWNKVAAASRRSSEPVNENETVMFRI